MIMDADCHISSQEFDNLAVTEEISAVTNERLLRDGRINITGLGIFKLRWRDGRQGINPQTSETIHIPAQNRVYFKSEAPLRMFIDRGHQYLKPEIIGDYIKPDTSFWRNPCYFRVDRGIFGDPLAYAGRLLFSFSTIF